MIRRTNLLTARTLHTSRVLRQEAAKGIEAQLRDGLKAAMKSKDRPAAACLKAVLADITYNAKLQADHTEKLPESAVIQTIRKGIAERTKAAESYAPDSPSPHPESHSNLLNEISLLQSYFPSTPSLDSITASIKDVIESLTEEVKKSKGVQGTVMKTLIDSLGDSGKYVDRKEIGRLVNEALKR